MKQFVSSIFTAGGSADKGKGPSAGKRHSTNLNGKVWKTATFLLVGVVLLVVTDVVKFKETGMSSVGESDDGAVSFNTNTKKSTDRASKKKGKGRGVEQPTIDLSTVPYTYTRRGQPMSDSDRTTMEKQWGTWTLVDDKVRPTENYYLKYPNRDIPRSEFPPNAWQTDKDYLSKFLPEATKLVQRGLDAILAEYGKTEGTWEERTEMFTPETFENLAATSGYVITKPEWRKDATGDRGGWTTPETMQSLKKSLVHAIMTEDSWVLSLGGHSAAAGHGNHFEQSEALQVGWILEPLFARLGVRHESRNFANGGLGTIQHAFASASVYGPAIDMLWWDSGKCVCVCVCVCLVQCDYMLWLYFVLCCVTSLYVIIVLGFVLNISIFHIDRND
jgi:hypothetical protein